MTNNELFDLINEGNIITLEFHKHEIEFNKDVSFFDDSFYKEIKGKDIRIKGKGSIEIYAYSAYWCAKMDCESITIYDFNLSRDIEIYRKGKTYADTMPQWCSITEKSDSIVASVIPSSSPDGRWAEDSISKNAFCFIYSKNTSPVILTGRGSLLFYSIMACSAAISNCENVVIEKPTEKNFITIAGSLFQSSSQNRKTGTMIGILGDPNSGKSVFSKVLGNILRQYSEEKSIWTYDCDAAAPTSDWYIYGLQRAQTQEESDIKINARKATKQKWTGELELKVAKNMGIVKSNLDLVVADFPGGKHNEEKNIHERIPSKERAEMLKNCDYFIIVGRSDKLECIEAWKTTLANYNLADKVIAEIISKNPQSLPIVESYYFDEKKFFHAEVCGLDRKNLTSCIVSAFCPTFKDFAAMILSEKP